MSGSTGNIRGEIARHEKKLERGGSETAKNVQRTTDDIALQGHGPLDMGMPEERSETHQLAAEVKAARKREENLSAQEKRALYERARAQLEEDGERMLRRMSSVA